MDDLRIVGSRLLGCGCSRPRSSSERFWSAVSSDRKVWISETKDSIVTSEETLRLRAMLSGNE